MPDCGVHCLWFALVCFFNEGLTPPPPRATSAPQNKGKKNTRAAGGTQAPTVAAGAMDEGGIAQEDDSNLTRIKWCQLSKIEAGHRRSVNDLCWILDCQVSTAPSTGRGEGFRWWCCNRPLRSAGGGFRQCSERRPRQCHGRAFWACESALACRAKFPPFFPVVPPFSHVLSPCWGPPRRQG